MMKMMKYGENIAASSYAIIDFSQSGRDMLERYLPPGAMWLTSKTPTTSRSVCSFRAECLLASCMAIEPQRSLDGHVQGSNIPDSFGDWMTTGVVCCFSMLLAVA